MAIFILRHTNGYGHVSFLSELSLSHNTTDSMGFNDTPEKAVTFYTYEQAEGMIKALDYKNLGCFEVASLDQPFG